MDNNQISVEQKMQILQNKSQEDCDKILEEIKQFQLMFKKRLRDTERRLDVMRRIQLQTEEEFQRRSYSFLPRAGALPIELKEEKGCAGEEKEEQVVPLPMQRTEWLMTLREGYSIIVTTFAIVYLLFHVLSQLDVNSHI